MQAPALPAPNVLARRYVAADAVGLAALAGRLARFVHPGHARIVAAAVEGGALVVHEEAVPGDALASEGRALLTDKVLALGQELVPLLAALAEAGLAHGQLDASRVVRTDDGALVVVGASGLRCDGSQASAADDVAGLARMLATLLPERAPAATRDALATLASEPVPLDALARRLGAIRAAIPVPAGRHIRSIKRLAFPPPASAPKKSKRHMLRLLLVSAVVGLGLYAAFSGSGTVAWTQPAAVATPSPPLTSARRSDDGKTLYIRLPPLPKRDATP